MMAKAIAPVLVAQGWGRIVNIQTSNFTMTMEGFALRPVQGGARGRDGDLGQGPRGHRRDRERARARGPANTRMIPAEEVADRSTLIQPEVMVAPIVWLMSARSDGVTGRRIIAKEWDAARLASEPPERVGAPAGW